MPAANLLSLPAARPPRLAGKLALLCICAMLMAMTASLALGAPSDALNILSHVGQSGIAQNVGLDQAKKDVANGIAKDAAAKTGAKVYVVLLKRDEDPGAYADLYTQLNMQGKDLLIASNGTKWEVKCAALTHDAKQTATDKALKIEGLDPLGRLRALTSEMTTAINQQAVSSRMNWNQFEAANAGKGWNSQRMSAEYERYKATGQTSAGTAIAAPGAQPVATPSSGSGVGTWVFLSLLIAGVVGFVLWRRKQRDANLGAELKAALQGPEQALTDVFMNMDGLENHPRFGQMLEAATACQAKVDELKKGQPTREAVSKARALNDEANRVRRQFDDARMAR